MSGPAGPASWRLAPLAGLLVGGVGGLVYWLASEVWPTSLAVVLSMLATILMTRAACEIGFAETFADGISPAAGISSAAAAPSAAGGDARRLIAAMLGLLLLLWIKYDALLALSAANLPFTLPPNVALGLIMLAGHGAGRALMVSAVGLRGAPAPREDARRDAPARVSGRGLAFALLIGFAPATLLGVPGLIGLVAAIVSRMALGAWFKRRSGGPRAGGLCATQQLAEVFFYMGALATWMYI